MMEKMEYFQKELPKTPEEAERRKEEAEKEGVEKVNQEDTVGEINSIGQEAIEENENYKEQE